MEYTSEVLSKLKAEELRQYDDWFIRKVRTGLEVPKEVIEACNAIDEKYDVLKSKVNGFKI